MTDDATLPLADQLLVHLSAADRRAAADTCIALVESGMPLSELVDTGLARAMGQVGRLWESAVWTVVDEHIATSAAEAALSAAAGCHRPPHTRGDVVVACVEGDWHSLPSRMVAEVLESLGWSVRFLGASHPTADLTGYARRNRPDAVLLTCSVPMALPALLSAVDGLHQLSIPVFVDGRALGPTAHRAALLGADGWAADATGAAEMISSVATLAPPAPAMNRLPAFHDLQLLAADWVERAVDELVVCLAIG